MAHYYAHSAQPDVFDDDEPTVVLILGGEYGYWNDTPGAQSIDVPYSAIEDAARMRYYVDGDRMRVRGYIPMAPRLFVDERVLDIIRAAGDTDDPPLINLALSHATITTPEGRSNVYDIDSAAFPVGVLNERYQQASLELLPENVNAWLWTEG